MNFCREIVEYNILKTIDLNLLPYISVIVMSVWWFIMIPRSLFCSFILRRQNVRN